MIKIKFVSRLLSNHLVDYLLEITKLIDTCVKNIKCHCTWNSEIDGNVSQNEVQCRPCYKVIKNILNGKKFLVAFFNHKPAIRNYKTCDGKVNLCNVNHKFSLITKEFLGSVPVYIVLLKLEM